MVSSSLVGQHIENVSSSHGKGKITKSDFAPKVSASDQGGGDPKSALNASENLKSEVGVMPFTVSYCSIQCIFVIS